MSWVVSGAAAVVQVAGISCYLGRGDQVPEEADEASVKHLAEVGLISEVEFEQAAADHAEAEQAAAEKTEAEAEQSKPASRRR